MDTSKPTEEFLRSIDVHELLPQQDPFVMIGSLKHYDDSQTVSETVISEDNLFVEDGVFTAPGMIENIAQTCAARIGYVNKYVMEKGIQLGFIGGIRNLEIFDNPKVGDVITTTVEVLENVLGTTLAKASITIGDKVFVTTDMKIAVRDGE